ncbi:GNAT family N-acetyltransferase [Soonwooa sp.]|uniref:GNAT family N-acetyltransferase n=1 Tax=Soonwooa sp. TaxID=1938592 RepID=UPI0026303773|nr:GNAT family N-acetyltransferase [Soonwooa sp.]
MKIEKATTNDHSTLTNITLDGKAFWGYSKEQIELWKKDLTISKDYIDENEVYKLIDDDEIIGYYSILKISRTDSKLDNLFLYQKYIGKGFGKILMNDFIERVKKSDCKVIILDSEPNAEEFYKKFGFETYDRLESSIKDRFLPKMKLNL